MCSEAAPATAGRLFVGSLITKSVDSFRFEGFSRDKLPGIAPECSKQDWPTATPQVGQDTERSCFRVMSVILT